MAAGSACEAGTFPLLKSLHPKTMCGESRDVLNGSLVWRWIGSPSKAALRDENVENRSFAFADRAPPSFQVLRPCARSHLLDDLHNLSFDAAWVGRVGRYLAMLFALRG